MNTHPQTEPLRIAVACLLTFACGTVDLEEPDAPGDEAAEFGDAEQALVGYSTGGLPSGKTSGVRTTSTRLSCNGSSDEVCLVPGAGGFTSKTIRWCFGNTGFLAGFERAALRTGIQRVDAQTNWTFSEQTTNCRITIGPIGGIGSGPTSNDLEAFLGWQTSGALTTLSEGVAGTYQAFENTICSVDIPDAQARFPTQADREKLLIHVGGACAAMTIGVGMRNDANATNSFTFRTMSTLNATRTLTNGEKCRADNYQLGNVPAYSIDGGICFGLP